MAGVLSFALGLESSAFSSGLDRAGGRLLAFLSIGKAVSAAFEGTWAAIERGGALNDLSARTGESVADLYRLEEAFKVVGISADKVPTLINRFNKSLSGVGEMGEKTTEAFAALGLSMDDLKRMDAPTQLSTVAAALAKLERGSGLDVAARLFGRGMGEDIMQISRDARGFSETLAASAREAAVFARNAAAFDKLGDTMTRIKGSLSGMFAGVAEGIVPMLQKMADALNQLDLVAIGQDIGTLFTGAFQAFQEGKISELIAESIIAGFEAAVVAIPGIFAQLGMVILRVMETPLTYIQAFYDMMVGNLAELLSKIPGNEGASQGGFMTFNDALKERKEQGLEFFTQGNTLDFMQEGIDAYWADAKTRLGDIGSGLFSTFKDFASRAPKAAALTDSKGNAEAALPGLGEMKKTNATSLEKMGFVMGGGAADYQKQTAAGVKTLVTEVRRTNKLLDVKPQTALVNS